MDDATLIAGVDVSGFTPAVDWELAARQGYGFCYARASHGNDVNAPGKCIGKDGTDVRFRQHVLGARAAGLAVGAYHVAFPLPHLDPKAQARWAYERADALGTAYGELDPVLDLEWPPRETPGQRARAEWERWGCSGNQIIGWTLAYLEAAESLWNTIPVLYTYPWFWQTVLQDEPDPGAVEALRRYRLWVADYRFAGQRPPEDVRPVQLRPWFEHWDLLQHDGNGGITIAGADVDANVVRAATLRRLLGVEDPDLLTPDVAERIRATGLRAPARLTNNSFGTC